LTQDLEAIRALCRAGRLAEAGGDPPVLETPCKLCGGAAALFGVVDFNKTCHGAKGPRLPVAGVPVHYRRCGKCGLVYTDAFDAFRQVDFAACIYNDAYAAVDPDFAERRPRANAALIGRLFGAARATVSLLDYGAGEGRLADILARDGWRAESHDPFHGDRRRPDGAFGLVTCFEVFEHTPDPKGLIDTLAGFLAPEGLILLSTLLQPPEIETLGLAWWYAAPRNGHITLFSKASLAALCGGAGLTLASFDDHLHVAYRRLPAFARHLMVNAPPGA